MMIKTKINALNSKYYTIATSDKPMCF